MKVVIVLPRLNVGGAERVMVRVASGLAARGAEVVLYVFSGGGALEAEVSPDVRVVTHSAAPLSIGVQLSAARRLVSLLRLERPDAVLSTLYQTNLLVAGAHRISGVRASLVLREANYVGREWPASKFYPVARVIGPPLYRRADAIVVPAAGQIEDLCDRLGVQRARVRHIGNPIVGRWMFEHAIEPLPEALARAWVAPRVLAIGRLSDQKAFDVLIRAFAQFRRRRGGSLLILGEGERREELASLAGSLGLADAVILPGVDTNPFRYLAGADLFVLSSRYEGLPNALIQALAFKVRCVATDCPSGPRELLDEGRLGQLVPVDDPAALATSMDCALDAPRPEPPEAWWQRYDEERVVDQYLDALTER